MSDGPNPGATAGAHDDANRATLAATGAAPPSGETIGAITQRAIPPQPAPHLAGAFAPGSCIDPAGRYRVERLLGKGGFGEAYLAHDLRLDRPCVIKHLVFAPDWGPQIRQATTAAFAREAQLLVSLNTPGHPHIPEIYDFFPASRCLVMKYIVGEDLAVTLRQRGAAFALDETLQIMCEAGSALTYLHSRTPEPVLHRDIKPANLLRDSERRVWLIDFGLAQPAMAVSRADLASGTPGYAPPEQWQGQALPASDVYALAATLYTLLTAQSLRVVDLSLIHQQGEAGLAPECLLPNAPPALDALVRRALSPDPAARPNAREFLDTLEVLRDQLRIPLPPAPERPPDIPGFVGRAAELAALSAELDRDGMVLLTGMPGVGKTSMAAALARQVADPGATFWHSFHSGEGTEGLIWDLAGFLAHQGHAGLWELLQQARLGGAPPPPLKVLMDYAVQLLTDAGGLLCLDDFHLVDDDPQIGAFIERLTPLHNDEHLRLIVTSRRVPAFALVDQVEILAGLNAGDAAQLMAGRGVVLDAALQVALYAQVGGNAQLLTLAADALRRASDPARLIGALTTADSVERYLLDEIDVTLSAEERGTMKPVAALLEPGGTRGAIEALADGANVRRPLRSLIDRYLLLTQETAAGKEYHQHAIVQRFYYEELGNGERAALHRRAAAYYEREEPDPLRAILHHLRAGAVTNAAALTLAHRNTALNSGQGSALLALMRAIDVAQIEPAQQQVELCLARGEMATLLRVGAVARSSFAQALALLAERDAAPAVRVARARACRGMGELLELENPQEAMAWLQRGLTELGGCDRAEEACLNRWVGATLMTLGQPAAAEASLERSLALLPPTDVATRADVLLNLGVAHCMRGDLAAGKELFAQSLEFYARSGQTWATLGVRQNLAQIHQITGNWIAASQEYQSALAEAVQLGLVIRQVGLALALGMLRTRQGQLDAALDLLTTAQVLAQREGLLPIALQIQSSLGDLYVRRGDTAAAEGAVQASLALATTLNTVDQLPEIYRTRSLLHLQAGDHPRALAAAGESLRFARVMADSLAEGMSLCAQGQVLAATGQQAEAQAAFAHSAELLADDPYELARARAAWGAALAPSDPVPSQALRAQARTAFAALGAQHDLAALDVQGA